MTHAFVRCDTCGSVDDHPKWHTSLLVPGSESECQSFHHDCAPAWLVSQHPDDHVVHKIRAAAASGVRGDALRAHIGDLHSIYAPVED